MKTLILVAFILSSSLYGQSFQKMYYKTFSQPLPLSNGNIGLARGGYYVMYDSMGVQVWTSKNNGVGVYSSQESSDNSVLLAGYSFSFPNHTGGFILTKKDSLGNTMWSKGYTDSIFQASFIEGSISLNNGIIIYGLVNTSSAPAQKRISICRIDSTGNILWGKVMNFGFSYLTKGILTREFDLVFAADDKVFKMDTSGNVIWARTCYPNGGFTSICQNHTGSYTLLATSSTAEFATVNLDTAGNILSRKKYISQFTPTVSDIGVLSDSNLVIFASAFVNNSPSLCDYTFYYLDSLQNPIYASHTGISMHCNTSYKLQTMKNGFVMTGYEAFDAEAHLIKVNNPYQIDCSDTFSFTTDTFNLSLTNTVIIPSNAFSGFSITDSSISSIVGENNFCGITRVALLEEPNIQIYPNPFTRQFTLNLTDLILPTVSIYDLYGRVVFSQTRIKDKSISFNFQTEPAGVYFVSIETEHLRIVKKIIRVWEE